MVGYDTSFCLDKDGNGVTLKVFMHWYYDENPPKNRGEALERLKNTIGLPEKIIDKFKDKEKQ